MTRDSATIQWQPPTSNGGSPLTGYVVERREEGRLSWMYCGRTDADVTILTCPSLTENTQYHFRVYAENRYGRSEPLETEYPLIPKRIFGKHHFVALLCRTLFPLCFPICLCHLATAMLISLFYVCVCLGNLCYPKKCVQDLHTPRRPVTLFLLSLRRMCRHRL